MRASIVKALRFCYDLSETDARVLFTLLRGGGYTVDDLTQKLGLSKATVSTSLRRLWLAGLVERRNLRTPGPGRPKYVYTLSSQKLYKKVENCVNEMLEELKKLFEEKGEG